MHIEIYQDDDRLCHHDLALIVTLSSRLDWIEPLHNVLHKQQANLDKLHLNSCPHKTRASHTLIFPRTWCLISVETGAAPMASEDSAAEELLWSLGVGATLPPWFRESRARATQRNGLGGVQPMINCENPRVVRRWRCHVSSVDQPSLTVVQSWAMTILISHYPVFNH